MQKTIAVIKPNVIENNQIPNVLWDIKNLGFHIMDMKYIAKANIGFVSDFYHCHAGAAFYDRLVCGMSNRPWLVLDIYHSDQPDDSIRIWRQNMPQLRKIYSSVELHDNGIHGSDSVDSYNYEYNLVFGVLPIKEDSFINLMGSSGNFCKIRKLSIIGVDCQPLGESIVKLNTGESLKYDWIDMLKILDQLE